MATFRVGIAQVEYTPELGLPLMGNFREDYGARGVHDGLFSRAIVIQSADGQKAALCSADVCMIDRDGIAMMREYIASKSDIPAANILIAGTHTHSGPNLIKNKALPSADDAAIKRCLKNIAESVIKANQNLADAVLSIGRGREERVSFNRRLKCKDGQTHMSWEMLDPEFIIGSYGPIDPEVIVLFVEQEGQLKAAAVNFALHPAVLTGDNWLYSADYPGYLAEAMTRLQGPEFRTLFFNGCCGDVTHIDWSDPSQGRGYQMTQRIGYMLAAAVQQASCNRVPLEGDAFEVANSRVTLERLKISPEDVKWSEEVLEKAKTNPTKGQVDGLPDEFYAKNWLEMHRKQDINDQVEVMTLRIGDLGIVGLPGEIFCEFGLDIKKNSPAKHTMVIELANDAIGYMPTRAAFEQGGYEPKPGSTHYVSGSGEKLVESAKNQLKGHF